jgi:hypothetical protein
MRAATLQSYKERILRVLVQIQQQRDEAISLEELITDLYAPVKS